MLLCMWPCTLAGLLKILRPWSLPEEVVYDWSLFCDLGFFLVTFDDIQKTIKQTM